MASKKKTRQTSVDKLSEFVGKSKEFLTSEVPTNRGVIQRGLLIKEHHYFELDKAKTVIHKQQTAQELAPLVLEQWKKSNAKFSPRVTIKENSVCKRIEKLWDRSVKVAKGQAKKKEVDAVNDLLDKVFDITTCNHVIMLCEDTNSGCSDPKTCINKSYINCSCPLASRVPVLELRWLYGQRAKHGEKSDMMMLTVDKKESDRQNRAEKRKNDESEAEAKRKKKAEDEERDRLSRQKEYDRLFSLEDQELEEEEPMVS
jgi:hypothetical protein